MKLKNLAYAICFLLILIAAISGCSSTITVPGPGQTFTVTGPVVTLPGATVTLPGPGQTITIPGSVVTLPGATVTLPGKTTTILVTTVSVPPITSTIPPQTTDLGGFLPTTPEPIVTHRGLTASLAGACLNCHGAAEWYNQFPMAPGWDADEHGSTHHTGFFYVLAGSIQDHTGRTSDECLTCHQEVVA